MPHTLSRFAITGLVLFAGCGGSGSNKGSGADRPPFGSEEFGLSDEELNARIEEAEGLIADCMTEAGFEYVPVDAVTVRDAMGADKSLPGVSDADFVAQYGFGITTVFQDPVAQQGRGEQNTRIHEALPDANRVAYDRALFGGEGNVSLARALEDEDLSSTGGCTRQAVEQLFSQEELAGTYTNPADVLLEQDQRMIDAIARWSTCMADAGYDYEHPDDVEDDLHEQFAAIVGDADPASLTGADLAALTELQGEERAIAAVTLQCEEKHIVPVESEVEAEIYGSPQP